MELRKLVIKKDRAGDMNGNAVSPGNENDQIKDTHSEQGTDVDLVSVGRRYDNVLTAAVRRGLLTQAQIDGIGMAHSGSDSAVSWRQVALARPIESMPLFDLAAEVYGFRPVRVCQIGTLIYNRKLTEYVSATDWNRLFERGIVPIIEYGKYPENVRHHLLACSDPGSRFVRSLLPDLPLSRTELVFVPKPGIQKLQRLLAENIPVLTINPFVLKRVSLIEQPVLRESDSLRRAA